MKNQSNDLLVSYGTRMEETYIISEILKATNPSVNQIAMQTDFFRQLRISRFQWINSYHPDAGDDQIRELKNVLTYLEISWNRKIASDDMIRERDYLKTRNVFHSIEQIQQEARIALGQDFDLSILFRYDRDDLGDLVKEDVIDLYNFIVNSKILKREEIVKLIYPIKYTDLNNCIEENGCTTSSYGFGMKDGKRFNSAAIGMDMSYEWYSELYFKNGYDCGDFATRDYSETFIHEFAHALCFFYDLQPQLKEVLNINIYDVNDPTLRVSEKFYNHFTLHFGTKNLGWFDTTNSFLIKKSLDYMINKMVTTTETPYNYAVNLFAKWILTPSFYGRKIRNVSSRNVTHEDTEWFAEGFTYYFLTERPDCEANWELWHQFLTKHVSPNQII